MLVTQITEQKWHKYIHLSRVSSNSCKHQLQIFPIVSKVAMTYLTATVTNTVTAKTYNAYLKTWGIL